MTNELMQDFEKFIEELGCKDCLKIESETEGSISTCFMCWSEAFNKGD